MHKEEAQGFLNSLLNQKLRIHTTDERMFWGNFKCTDSNCNIVLSETFEYHKPSPEQRVRAVAALGPSADAASFRMELSHRYLGLIVVPGQYIVKIEKEEFSSQLPKKE